MDNHVSDLIAKGAHRVAACVVGTSVACTLALPAVGSVAFAADGEQASSSSIADSQAQGAESSLEPHITLSEEPFEALSADAFPYAVDADDAQGSCELASDSCKLAYDENLIKQLGIQNGPWSGACLGYAAAYCQMITTGQYHSWAEFDGNGGYDESNFYGRNMTGEFDCWNYYDQQSTLRALYDAINAGHPCIVYVTTTSGNQHWVAVVGYENVSDPNNLSPESFIMLDPNYAFSCEPCSLTTHGYVLRYGDTFGNVRVSKGYASIEDLREPYLFEDCYRGDWFVDSGDLEYVVNQGLMTGYAGTNLFGPWDNITRGQVVVVLYRLCGSPVMLGDPTAFSDVDYGMYYGSAIDWARRTGVVNGYGDTNTFCPDQPVSREELAHMITNYASRIANVDTSTSYEALLRMPDADSVQSWARDSVSWCLDAGIIKGVSRDDGRYIVPDDGAWRASMATMVTVLQRNYL